MGNNCIVIFYVDDFCMFFEDKYTIDALFKKLSKTFNLTKEEEITSYLGINFSKYPDGTITMSQPENINKQIKHHRYLR